VKVINSGIFIISPFEGGHGGCLIIRGPLTHYYFLQFLRNDFVLTFVNRKS
jgi:hypothetical protein